MNSRPRHSSVRRRYLVAYDICDPVRLRAVHKTVKAHGEPIQYSIFLCDLSPGEKTSLKWTLSDLMHHTQDSVFFLDLGDPQNMTAFDFMGERAELPSAGPKIL